MSYNWFCGEHEFSTSGYQREAECPECHRICYWEGGVYDPNTRLPDPELQGQTYRKKVPIKAIQMDRDFEVRTLEGIMYGNKGDYLAKGIKGEYWAIQQEIFKQTYEKVVKCDQCGSEQTFFNEVTQEQECRICHSEIEA